MVIPSFTDCVPDNGYRWWYLDAISDDKSHAITIILFIGSVFSPYYARARKKRDAPADQHCAVNVALYGKSSRWCMTERTASSVKTADTQLSIGKSRVCVQDNQLQLSIDEIAVPLPSKVSGKITIDLPAYDLEAVPLDNEHQDNAQHFWQPIAPQSRINVAFSKPEISWQGSAYVDSNYGAAPLESSFKSWVWSRSHAADGTTRVLYDIENQQGILSQRSFKYAANGDLETCLATQTQRLPSTRYWRIPRETRTPSGTHITKLQTLEDTPFYSRSQFLEEHSGQSQWTVHESLYLDRFDTSWVRTLLPFRMPRSRRTVLVN